MEKTKRDQSNISTFVLLFILWLFILTILFSFMKVPHLKKENHHINYSAMQKYIKEPFKIINTNEQSIFANKIAYTIKINSELYSIVINNGKVISYNKIDKITE